MQWFNQAAKSIYAFGTTFIAAIGVVLVGNTTFSQITDGQWVAAAGLALGAAGAVYGVTNTPK